MLPASRRIPHRYFDIIKKRGSVYHSTFFTLRVIDSKKEGVPLSSSVLPTTIKRDDTTRFSVVVSQKVSKKAVVRIRLKRRMYALLEHFANNTLPSYLLVFHMKKTALEASNNELEDEIHRAFVTANVLWSFQG